jgi:hypothetical protein
MTRNRQLLIARLRGLGPWLILCCLLTSSASYAKATVITLSALTKESSVIVLGRVVVPKENAAAIAGPVSFEATMVLKGGPSVQVGTIALCNSRPNEEWPDVSTLTGEVILFVLPHGTCFNLSHNYRSVVKVQLGQASTGEIRGEPENQPLDRFLDRLRTLISTKP